MDIIFQIAILIMSVAVHEVSHGVVANSLGDPTARYAGRLTLNPLKHLDPIGSVLVPLLLVLLNAGFIFGWARPVPYNPYNLRDQRWGEAKVAAAGPLSNIALAAFFGLLVRFGEGALPDVFIAIAIPVILINIVLAVFNLIPIPPLDGSKVLFSVLPYHLLAVREFLERYGFFLVLVFIVFLWQFLMPLIGSAFSLLTGLSF